MFRTDQANRNTATHKSKIYDEKGDIDIQHRKTGTVKTTSKIFSHHCHDRFCPICVRKRSDHEYAMLYKVCSQIKDDHKGSIFLFLTTTVPNFAIDELGVKYKAYSKGNTRFLQSALFKNVKGWYRTTEITKGRERGNNGKLLKNRVHLHWHWLLVVDKKYFKKENYITQDKWLDGCRKSYRDANIKILDIRMVKNLAQGLREVCKYIVKPGDFFDDVETFTKLDTFLHKKRFIAKGGVIKTLLCEAA
ncbi:MAG: protein rep [Deferribacteraceae bacterium]|nr:protein rep [Deferribacteraceae bacterium]